MGRSSTSCRRNLPVARQTTQTTYLGIQYRSRWHLNSSRSCSGQACIGITGLPDNPLAAFLAIYKTTNACSVFRSLCSLLWLAIRRTSSLEESSNGRCFGLQVPLRCFYQVSQGHHGDSAVFVVSVLGVLGSAGVSPLLLSLFDSS